MSAAVGAAATDIKNAHKHMLILASQNQKQCFLNRYENDKVEQYQRKDNLRIFGLDEVEQARRVRSKSYEAGI